jgi:tetratricopeptide (TPR) repeat protein
LTSHESYPILILQTKIEAVQNIQGILSGISQRKARLNEQSIRKMFSDGTEAYKDFETRGNLQSLAEAISKFETITKMAPEDDPKMPLVLSNLGSFLLRRFEQLGRMEDMDKGIERFERALSLTSDGDPGKTSRLCNLGNSLQTRFKRLGALSDLDAAITQQEAAVSLTPDNHPKKASYLSNLGNSLQARFKRLGSMDDINAAISQQQAANNLTPDDHPNKPMFLNNLGSSLLKRFERLGNIDDIDGAILQYRAAVNLTPDGHPSKPSRLSNLGISLQSRFKRLEDIIDIDAAIIEQQAAVNLTPDGHPNKPIYLNNLGNSLRTRFERLRNLDDIDDAIIQQRVAVDLSPDGHPDRPMYLTNLGNSLLRRFGRLGNQDDIDTAIIEQQKAVNITPDGHPNKPIYLNNLGNSLLKRFEQLGNPEDIDGAIIQQQAAVNLAPGDHFNVAVYSDNLGTSYRLRYLHLRYSEDAQAALSHFSASAKSSVGPPTIRFKAVRQWISMASHIKHHSLLDAYECALGLMPLVAWLGLPIANRYEHLIQMGGIARDAAAAAISLEEYEKAVEWLEQGRSIVWSQILQLRSPVDELRVVNSDLADRLLRVSQLLDNGPRQEEDLGYTEESTQRYRALTREWESIIEQIRHLPKFEDFLKTPKVSKLMSAAQDGPVVVLNINEERCDALALVPGFEEVIHIPLPNISLKSVTGLRDELKDVLYSSGLRLRGDRAAQRWTDESDSKDSKTLLAEIWTGLVKPVLDSFAFSVSYLSIPFGLMIMIYAAESRCTSTYLVVSNRIPRIPPNTCRRNIRFRPS